MKYLILFFSLNVFAANWMSEADIKKVHDGVYPRTVYTSDRGGMYQIDNCKPDVCSIQSVEVDDIDKPKYNKMNVQACNGKKECEDNIQDKCGYLIPEGSTTAQEVCIPYCQDFPNHDPYISKNYKETYCAMQIGYYKKIKKVLVQDQTLINKKNEKKNKEGILNSLIEIKNKHKDLIGWESVLDMEVLSDEQRDMVLEIIDNLKK